MGPERGGGSTLACPRARPRRHACPLQSRQGLLEGAERAPVLSADPPAKLLRSGADWRPPPLLGLQREAGGGFPAAFSACHSLAGALPFVGSCVHSVHAGVLTTLLPFFCNCRIIKYFNFKVSNFLLHT